jgi:hypothetical protein
MADNADPNQAVDLVGRIDALMKKVHTQSLDLSFNELLDMHAQGELNISPDYQRLFQWSEAARSRFIESLLLEMPVPPIFVVEEDDGKYLLIDGLQRISSYLHLRGKLVAPHLDPPVDIGDKLTFIDCDIVKDLDGKTYDELGAALQIRLKRSFIREFRLLSGYRGLRDLGALPPNPRNLSLWGQNSGSGGWLQWRYLGGG